MGSQIDCPSATIENENFFPYFPRIGSLSPIEIDGVHPGHFRLETEAKTLFQAQAERGSFQINSQEALGPIQFRSVEVGNGEKVIVDVFTTHVFDFGSCTLYTILGLSNTRPR